MCFLVLTTTPGPLLPPPYSRQLTRRTINPYNYNSLHQLLLGTLRANNVRSIRDESPADQGCRAQGTNEAIVVPVTVLEGDESCSTDS